eukprot:1682654-Rhodomonas_salina.1
MCCKIAVQSGANPPDHQLGCTGSPNSVARQQRPSIAGGVSQHSSQQLNALLSFSNHGSSYGDYDSTTTSTSRSTEPKRRTSSLSRPGTGTATGSGVTSHHDCQRLRLGGVLPHPGPWYPVPRVCKSIPTLNDCQPLGTRTSSSSTQASSSLGGSDSPAAFSVSRHGDQRIIESP